MKSQQKNDHTTLLTQPACLHPHQMLGTIISRISIWLISRQITARHTYTGHVSAYRHHVEGAIIDALNTERISVYWGVWESGKSRAARNVALRFQEVGRLAILLDGFKNSDCSTMHEWLRRGIGVSEVEENVSKYFAQPTSIIIDHFDYLMDKYEDLMPALSKLDTGIVLIVSSWERAVDLRDRGCRMVGSSAGVGRWNEGELRSLFASLPEAIQEKWTDEDEKNELLRLSALAGSPGFLTFSVYGNKCGNQAQVLDAEWRKGIAALEGTGDDSDAERLPEKDGAFHWD